ncbi:MAG: response regulator [Candidatus Margulisiibacteriota bacterium]
MNSEKPCILIVDDEESIRESFSLILQDEYDLISVSTGEAALKKAVDHKIDLVFLDIRMPGMDGMETLTRLKKIDPSLEVVMVTAVNDVQKAGESVKIGANNYIVKPFDVPRILAMAKTLTRKKNLMRTAAGMRKSADGLPAFPELSGHSKTLQALIEKAVELAKTDLPLLIIGEPGTEKETAAFIMHSSGKRKDAGFGVLNLPKNGNEKELYKDLFGSGKGSFVYDLDKKAGLVERCAGGTVLINNIENASQQLLADISEAIEKKGAKRYGSSQDIALNVRFIFSSSEELASSENPEHNIPGNLINDSLLIPPLRSRREDIQDICLELLAHLNKELGKRVKEITPDTQEILNSYPWPGNFEELKNILKKTVAASDNEILSTKDLPFCILMWSPAFSYIEEASGFSLDSLTSVFEKEFLLNILRKSNFEIQTATKVLNINKNILLSKIEALQIK